MCSWLIYYLAVGLFAAGMMFGIVIIDKHKSNWLDWISVILSGMLWPLIVLYVILQEKYR